MRDNSGYIKLHRKITDWEWYHDTNTVRLFLHFLLIANYADSKFEGKLIKRGQLVTSLPSLADETGLSIQQVRTATDHLKATGEITVNQQPKYRVITVVKYDQYQTDNRVPNRQSTGNQQAINSPATGEQQHNKNIRKEEYKEEKETIDTSPSRGDGFDDFWKIYPKKISKQDAMKAWKALKPNAETQAKIMSSLTQWIASDQWQRENGQYIPYPATWIRKRRWEDEPEQRSAPAPAPKQQPKLSSAHNFDERDYSNETWADMDDIAAQLRRFKESGEVSI